MAISPSWVGDPKEWVTSDTLTAELFNDEVMSRLLYIYDKMIPVGLVVPFAGVAFPGSAPFLYCNGAAVSRTTYANLFAIIGTTYGVGDGATTFNIPDLRGRTVIGQGAGTGLTTRALGAKGGEETHVLTIAELASHVHSQHPETLRQQAGVGSNSIGSPGSSNYTTALAGTQANGSDSPHNNMQPFLTLVYGIRF